MEFKKAERKSVKLKLALTGPSGSGKTYSALRLAAGLVEAGLAKRIAFIDTENDSASLYANDFDFDAICIDPPYTIEKYRQAFLAAAKQKFDVVVCDSLTHAWAGEGGLLAKKESLDSRGGNSYTNWGSITKDHESFKAAILSAPFHFVCTMRSKQDYVLETNDKGKAAPKKVGMAPIQRDGMEYEFTTVFDISMNHEASVSKDRTNLFDGQIFKITEQTGRKIAEWLNTSSGSSDQKKKAAPVVEKNKKESAKSLPKGNDVPGLYVIKSGKHEGKTLQSLSQEQLLESIMAVEKWAKQNGKDLNSPTYAAVNEFVLRAKEYLSLEIQENESAESFNAY